MADDDQPAFWMVCQHCADDGVEKASRHTSFARRRDAGRAHERSTGHTWRWRPVPEPPRGLRLTEAEAVTMAREDRRDERDHAPRRGDER